MMPHYFNSHIDKIIESLKFDLRIKWADRNVETGEKRKQIPIVFRLKKRSEFISLSHECVKETADE